jgi:hypothetical protein
MWPAGWSQRDASLDVSRAARADATRADQAWCAVISAAARLARELGRLGCAAVSAEHGAQFGPPVTAAPTRSPGWIGGAGWTTWATASGSPAHVGLPGGGDSAGLRSARARRRAVLDVPQRADGRACLLRRQAARPDSRSGASVRESGRWSTPRCSKRVQLAAESGSGWSHPAGERPGPPPPVCPGPGPSGLPRGDVTTAYPPRSFLQGPIGAAFSSRRLAQWPTLKASGVTDPRKASQSHADTIARAAASGASSIGSTRGTLPAAPRTVLARSKSRRGSSASKLRECTKAANGEWKKGDMPIYKG